MTPKYSSSIKASVVSKASVRRDDPRLQQLEQRCAHLNRQLADEQIFHENQMRVLRDELELSRAKEKECLNMV